MKHSRVCEEADYCCKPGKNPGDGPLDATYRPLKRERSAVATVQELTALKKLKDDLILDADEYERLKQKLVEECLWMPLWVPLGFVRDLQLKSPEASLHRKSLHMSSVAFAGLMFVAPGLSPGPDDGSPAETNSNCCGQHVMESYSWLVPGTSS